MMRHRLILPLFFMIGIMAYGQTMSLAECVRQGIARNRSVANARIDVQKGHTAVSQNRARLLPMINGVFQFTDYLKQPVNVTSGTLLGNDFPDNPTWQTIRSMQYNVSTGIQMTMPLYNHGIYMAVDVAKTVERMSVISCEKATEELTMQIGRVYYLAQSYLEHERLMGENVSRMQELCDITEAMFEQGVVLEVDLERARINLQNLSTLKNQFAMLYNRHVNMLRYLLDLAPETPLEIERMSDEIELFPASEVNDALPEMRLATMQKELTERKIRAVKAGYIPSVSLTGYAGGLGYQEKLSHFFHTEASSRNWFGNCFVGLNITIPLFDADSKRLQIRQHRYDALQAENRIALLRERLSKDYSDALLLLNHNMEVYNTQSQSCRQARNVYDVTEEQYREGVSSMTALLQDEMQLRTSQSSCVQAHCEYNLARLDLLRLSGNLSSLTD